MKEKGKTRIVVFGDSRKGNVSKAIDDFKRFAESKTETITVCSLNECTAEMLKEFDFAVVFGGDGSIINSARQLSESDTPVAGVNLGKLGYLAEFNIEQLKEHFDDITAGGIQTEKRMMLNCEVTKDGREVFSSKAVNEVFITAGQPYRMIDLQLTVNGQSLAGCVSDGIIVATPTGSTAYSLSAGGPIIAGNMQALVISPICPHSLSFRPIVINASSVIEIEGLELNKGTTLSVDGQIHFNLTSKHKVRIKKDKSQFKVINNPEQSPWDTLAAKLGWAEKPRYQQNSSK
jgi:NAD+ kinase